MIEMIISFHLKCLWGNKLSEKWNDFYAVFVNQWSCLFALEEIEV